MERLMHVSDITRQELFKERKKSRLINLLFFTF